MKWGERMPEQESIGKSINYLIHAVPSRMWYVEQYLIPRLVKLGVDKNHIKVYNDINKKGNLLAFMDSIKDLKEDTWHLQDDILPATNFKEVTEKDYGCVVCGFCSAYCSEKPVGYQHPEQMWYSFPCIFIPGNIIQEFYKWLKVGAIKISKYYNWIKANKFDDSLFMEFMKLKYSTKAILNLTPNVVNHVDYLLGGSVVNKNRSRDSKATYWNEPELLREWEVILNGRSRD